MAFRITVQQLMRAVPNANRTRVAEFVEVFNKYNEQFEINTVPRLVHFLSQVTLESGRFNYVEENLNYSASRLLQVFPKYFNKANVNDYAGKPEKIANRVYANRMGNGNEASGDGWRFRGRGFIQLTGREAYSAYQNSGFCNGALIYHPEWLTKAPGHTKSAMWFFRVKGCNTIADRDDGGTAGEQVCKDITYKVNGGYNGLADRLYYYRRYKKEFGLK